MSPTLLLDTNIIADHFNGIKEATALIIKSQKCALSVITYAETLVGLNKEQEDDFTRLIEGMTFLNIEQSTGRIAAHLKQKFRFKWPDCYQAALAIEHKMILVTRNTKDFDPAIHIFVRIPYRLM